MNHISSIIKEVLSKPELTRVPEAMVMSESEQAQDFYNYGLGDTVLRASYLFHAKWASKSFAHCKRVLDLGTGPANQISILAKMNPHIEFVGVDLSEKMLELAERNCRNLNLKNISFVKDNITILSKIKDHSFDGVFSSVALHHLPSEQDLAMTFRNVSRVLTANSAVYITDFMLLKKRASIDYLLSLNKDQPKIFKDDYYASLLAAFTKNIFMQSAVPVLDRAKMYTSFGAQFLMILKSKSHPLSPLAEEYLDSELQKLSKSHRNIYNNLSILFSLSRMN